MKNLLLIMFVFLFTVPTFAQKNKSVQEADDLFKASKSNFVLEVGFIPFNLKPITLTQLKGRFFLSNKIAIRMGANFSYTNKNDVSCLILGLYPGMEYHIGNLKRLSPYLGAEVNFYYKGYKCETGGTVITGGKSAFGPNGWTDLGLNVLAGFDFYFSKHIYMGAEFYYGFALQIKHEITQIEPTESVLVKRSKTFNVLGNAIPAIRLGWAF